MDVVRQLILYKDHHILHDVRRIVTANKKEITALLI